MALVLAELGRELGDDPMILFEQGGAFGRDLIGLAVGDVQTRAAFLQDRVASALVAVEVARAVLDAGVEGVAQVLLVVEAPAEQHLRRLLVDVLELLGAQPAALGETAGDQQLALLPFTERLAYLLIAEARTRARNARQRQQAGSPAIVPSGLRSPYPNVHIRSPGQP
jgi:hypothetical protein